jgi:hypothetical protein
VTDSSRKGVRFYGPDMPSAWQRLQMRVIVVEEDDGASVPTKMLPRKRTRNMLRPVNFGTAKGWRSGDRFRYCKRQLAICRVTGNTVK